MRQCDSGAVDQGLATLRAATRQRPDHKKAWANLAKALAGVGDLKGLQELARSRPECNAGQAYLGKVLMDRGQYEDAIKPLRKAIELDANDSWALTLLGVGLARLGREDDSVAALKRVLALTPTDDTAHVNLGSTLYQKRDFDGASRHSVKLYDSTRTKRRRTRILATPCGPRTI